MFGSFVDQGDEDLNQLGRRDGLETNEEIGVAHPQCRRQTDAGLKDNGKRRARAKFPPPA